MRDPGKRGSARAQEKADRRRFKIFRGCVDRVARLTVEARPYKARYVVLRADKVFLLIPWYYQEAARCPAPPLS
jgi:hypothetical protein